MPPLGGKEEFERYRAVLDEASRFADFINWKPRPADFARKVLGQTTRAIELLICENRIEISQKEENRSGSCFNEKYWYSLVIKIDGMDVFIESILQPASGNNVPDLICVVSMHESIK